MTVRCAGNGVGPAAHRNHQSLGLSHPGLAVAPGTPADERTARSIRDNNRYHLSIQNLTKKGST